MKRTIFNFVVTVLVVALSSREVYAKAALAQVRIQVVDQDGCIVPGAKIWGGFTCGPGMNDFVEVDGITDTNGMYVAQGKCNEFLRFEVRKEGYYLTEEKIFFGRSKADPIIADGKWQPCGVMMEVVLKKIKNPIKMVVPPSRINEAISLGEWHEYDLVAREWMPPYGNGKQTDVLIRLGLEAKNDISDFRATMDLCFTNSPYSGVYRMQKEQFSEMKSCYVADTNAVYETMVSNLYEKRPHKKTIDTRLTEDSYFVFRIRTTVDAFGKLVSAHYGKILGPWEFFGTMRTGTVCFNPTPNDTNLEDAETARLSRLGYKQSLEFERRRKAGGK